MKKLIYLCTAGIVATQFASAALISLYEFDGSTADSVRGTGFDAKLLEGTSAYVTGKSGQAFRFNSSTLLRAPVAGAGLSSFSFSAWVYFQELTTWGSILKNWGSPDVGAFHLGLDEVPNRISSFLGKVDGEAEAAFSGVVTTHAWYHVGVTIGPEKQYLYINGTQAGDSPTPGQLNQDFQYMSFGGKLNNAQNGISTDAAGWLNGYLDDVAFFNQELTALQMYTVYNQGLSGNGIDTLGYEGSPSAIPEPGSCLGLAGLLSSGLLLRQRRRVQRG